LDLVFLKYWTIKYTISFGKTKKQFDIFNTKCKRLLLKSPVDIRSIQLIKCMTLSN